MTLSKPLSLKTIAVTTFAGLALAAALAGPLPAAAQTPGPGASTKASPAAASVSAKAAPLDINSASKADLMALKGVGDKRAEDIVKGRPYKGKDDLVQRKILPQGIYDGIKDKIIAKQK